MIPSPEFVERFSLRPDAAIRNLGSAKGMLA